MQLITRTVGRLAEASLPLVAVALLRAFDPLAFATSSAWIAVAAPLLGGIAMAAACGAWLVDSLGDGGAPATARAAATGVLAVGLWSAALSSLDGAAGTPGTALAIGAAGGGILAAAAAALPQTPYRQRRDAVVGLAVLFALLEAVAATNLLPGSVSEQVQRLGLATGAVAAIAAAATSVARAAGRSAVSAMLLAAGALAALAIARWGSLDVVPGMIGLAVAGLMSALAPLGAAAPHDEPAAEPAAETPAAEHDWPVEADSDTEAATPAVAGPVPLPDPSAPAAAETRRLTRELRGTIEELMQARRIVELQRTEISRAAAVDPLTGTASRRAILERLAVEVAEAGRYSHPVAILLIDVDGFGALNADAGLAVGDAVLRELALRLRLRIRAADALGRVGGDSFLAILPHTDERGAATFAGALLRRLTARPVATERGELMVPVSIGVALMRPGMELSDEGLLAAAEEALGSARAAGGNRIAFDRLHGLARLDDRPRGA